MDTGVGDKSMEVEAFCPSERPSNLIQLYLCPTGPLKTQKTYAHDMVFGAENKVKIVVSIMSPKWGMEGNFLQRKPLPIAHFENFPSLFVSENFHQIAGNSVKTAENT